MPERESIMPNKIISEIKRIFTTRLDALDHILSVGEQHVPDMNAVMHERLAPDMLPFGAQIAFACNQPRGFSQWCAGQPIENLSVEVDSVELARSHIAHTKGLVADIAVDDSKLDEIKRIGLGPGRYCELPARRYVNDYLMPNLYFHITTVYAMLRERGAPLGKSDFLNYLKPHIRETS